jgi:hypothetical protein
MTEIPGWDAAYSKPQQGVKYIRYGGTLFKEYLNFLNRLCDITWFGAAYA